MIMKKDDRYLKGNFELMRQVNSRLVLDSILREKAVSRAELARKTGLQPATVGNTVARLLDEGLLVEAANNKTNRTAAGRPGQAIQINKDFCFVLAVDMEPDHLRLALMNMALDIVAYAEYSLNRFDHTDKIMDQLISGCESLLSTNELWRDKLIGMALSLPGEIDVENGIACGSTNMPNWHNVRIVERLSSALDVPSIRIGKSIHLAALSEKWRRPEIYDRNILCLVLRTGIGVALLINGSLYTGASHLDGEIGHTTVDVNGEKCECGNIGCLENFISSKSIRQRAIDMMRDGRVQQVLDEVGGDTDLITPEIIYRLAKNGDADCIEIVRDVSKYLGLATANLVQVLNPHEVIICGSIDTSGDILLEEINYAFDRILLPKTRADVEVMLSPYEDRASLYGAAVMVLDELFKLPDMFFRANARSLSG